MDSVRALLYVSGFEVPSRKNISTSGARFAIYVTLMTFGCPEGHKVKHHFASIAINGR